MYITCGFVAFVLIVGVLILDHPHLSDSKTIRKNECKSLNEVYISHDNVDGKSRKNVKSFRTQVFLCGR